MIRLFRVFFGFEGSNPVLVLACLLIASIAQGLGVASLVPLISLVGNDAAGSQSFAGRMVTNALATIGLSPQIEILLVIVTIAVTIKSILTIVAMLYVAKAVANVGGNLRTRLIDNLFRANWSYFVSKPTGKLVNSIGFECTMSGHLYLLTSRVLSSAIQTFVYIIVAFAISWQIALASLVMAFVIIAALQFLVRRSEKAGKRNVRHSRELVTQMSDAILGMKPLKAMAREDAFADLFHRKIAKVRQMVRREIASKNMLSNMQEPLLTLLMCCGFYVLVAYLDKPVASIVVMGILLQRTVNQIGKVQAQYQEATAVESAYHSVRDIIDEAANEPEPAFGRRLPTLKTGCRFECVSFAYGERPILSDLSLDIPANRMTLLVGPSGAGKTTVTDLLLGFLRPQSGRILIDDASLADLDIRAWRKMIGYVPQDLTLLHDSVLANITLGDESLGESQVWEALRMAGAAEFVLQLADGLATEVGEKGSRLSGGQRQRIALARALVHQPKLLILDEVTSALDAETEAEICENIKRISHVMTTLAISHREAWIGIADHIVYLGDAATDDDAPAGGSAAAEPQSPDGPAR